MGQLEWHRHWFGLPVIALPEQRQKQLVSKLIATHHWDQNEVFDYDK
jgi:hypothetical protein